MHPGDPAEGPAGTVPLFLGHPETYGSQGHLTQQEGRSPCLVPGPGQADSPTLAQSPARDRLLRSQVGRSFLQTATQGDVCFLTHAFSQRSGRAL